MAVMAVAVAPRCGTTPAPRGRKRNARRGRSCVGAVVALLALVAAAAATVLPRAATFVGLATRANLHAMATGSYGHTSIRPVRAATGMTEEAPVEVSEDEEQLRILSVTLLQRVGNAEDIVEAADMPAGQGDREIDLMEFRQLLSNLELDCPKEQSAKLFSMIDVDGSGSISVSELKDKLRESDAITTMYSESLQNVGLTVAASLVLAVGFAVVKGPSAGLDFATAYIVEDSLSVDNLFVFLLLFKFFKVPPLLQTYCLNLGIYGAVILRGLFIFVGLAAVKAFQPLLLFFAAFLVYASYTALASGEDEDDDEGPPDFVNSLSEVLPATDKFDGERLVVEGPQGGWVATPLALCIIAVELSDILFAVDSIPAVFAVTDDPAVVFTSNIAAILGLRSLYQVLSVAVQDLVYLEKAVAVVLGFVGVKLGLEVFGVEVSSLLSLAVILGLLGLGIGLSIYAQNEEDYDRRLKSPTIVKLLKAVKGFLE